MAHSSPQVVRDVLKMTDVPIVLSHSGSRSHCPVKRNLPDDLMRAIAATGGVIGMGYWAEVTCDEITSDGIAKMINAGIAAVGEDHISLGSDFDGAVRTACDTSELPALTDALICASLNPARIIKGDGGQYGPGVAGTAAVRAGRIPAPARKARPPIRVGERPWPTQSRSDQGQGFTFDPADM